MSLDKNKEFMIRWIDAVNSRDDARIDQLVDELFAPEYVLHDPAWPADLRGQEAVRKWAHGWIKSQSMIQMVIDEVIGEGDRLAYRATITQTNVQSGKTVRFPLMFIIHFANEKLVEEWELTGPSVEIV
jgi:predicted ester cyclase